MNKLIPVEFENQRILTTKQLAEVYQTTEGNISNNFNNNIEHFERDKHYFLLQGEELRAFKRNSYDIGIAPNVNKLYLWTERGANRHCKILDTDKAWEQFDNLEETYFRVKENVKALNTSELSPELQMFNQMFKAIANNELEQKKLKADIERANEKVEQTKEEIKAMREAITLDSNGWRKETATLINKIANKLGGFEHIRNVREESYKLLNETYGVDINRRLKNKQKNMALEGVSRSKINKVNLLDVIAEDKKLLNGYINIVTKMAIRYGVA
ncbi:MAG: ORF6N domain-containing protein [Clostridium sp.]|uniref:ORF6N domain-containing protein n=1 Tax=Clostridium sp. TaxID=1506 RepID=UPI00290542B2|nr:ORF6N domain-containing protein [Clostridium sp.]MDU1096405.1 ORF6N domain-containing protein [Clostridioides difficile]MDU1075700.1 ORF6N domain-containing protein [Clostridium sp.]MDU1126331.1 ORF6N domain-containing protein [Clostridium sp.]MDU3677229.1 ORF6N domain-containing protein [Clostridium sp.]MDU4726356.1 ORF6N domain-containing protein [Clostridium sp.]